jgi:hypothetical protein
MQNATAYVMPASPHEQQGPQDQLQTGPSINLADAAVVERIRMLGTLRDDGLLTEEEFQEKKTALLSNWPYPMDHTRRDLSPTGQIQPASSLPDESSLPEPHQSREWGYSGPPQTPLPPLQYPTIPPAKKHKGPSTLTLVVGIIVILILWVYLVSST